MLKRLTDFCMQELYDIDVCSECYKNANTIGIGWFSMVCQSPHILVWARMFGDRVYFPAKVMAIKKMQGNAQIHVQFFGSKNRNAFVQPANCYLFSKESPKGVKFYENQATSVRNGFFCNFFICSYNLRTMDFICSSIRRIFVNTLLA